MPRLARALGAAALLAAGLVLPTSPAQAAACQGTSGVSVVIDYGSSRSTACAPGDPDSAVAALRAVATVTPVPMYGDGVVCKINGVPQSQTCQRMPPADAYWAFWTAKRGGTWAYSTSGVASYDPAPGTVIGFAFGAGRAPSSPPPGSTTSATPTPSPKPSPKPSPTPSPTPSKPRTTPGGTPTPRSTAATTPRTRVTVLPDGTTTTVQPSPRGSATSSAGPSASRSGASPATTADGSTTSSSEATADGGGTPVAAAATNGEGDGSATTLFAGLGLVGLVGGAAAYVGLRRRADG